MVLVSEIQKNMTFQFNSFWTFYVRFDTIKGPDSRDSYNEWKTVMKTIDLYNQKIKLTYQFNPLSFHFYAYKANQGN